ncbi:sodium-coupled monocarboxylate transporter 2-like [Hyalella azteca]|uniref:Sodium-coupled monocarboxylate transporter 2-like n=1 Tax=Hyalella azteca TaxID=294128 RepID=A0A979FMN1_HYAAZ|nr:sodium-coupled monocarboxylate transporter 2-like [Hyalella azteca]
MADIGAANFGAVDYCVFVAMLGISLGIGFNHCVRGNKTTEDFLLASKSMSPVPIAFSLTATLVSSVSILGMVFGMLIAIHVFIPVIYPLRLDSINEYLERRFRSHLVKNLVMFMTSVAILINLGIGLYAPTLALESVTPITSVTYVLVLGFIVTIYSSFGGMKAVVWTDVFQTIVIVLGVIVIVISTTVIAGGPVQVWRIGSEYHRTDALDWRFGLFVRHTVFNTVLKDLIIVTAQYAFHQSTVQRLATLRNLQMARMVLYLNMIGVVFILTLLILGGLCIFAVYAGCDPITLGLISRKDQILPYFVIDYLGFLHGIPGLFVACLVCGTLSTISSLLNSLTTMVWKDIMCEITFFKTASENVRTITTKGMTFLFGMIMIALALSASRIDGLIQAATTVMGIQGGPNYWHILLGHLLALL